MEGRPHVHEPEVRRRWLDGTGAWQVRYGDTKVWVWRWGRFRPTARAVVKATRRAVRRHDRGSLKAESRAERQRRIYALVLEAGPQVEGREPWRLEGALVDQWPSQARGPVKAVDQAPLVTVSGLAYHLSPTTLHTGGVIRPPTGSAIRTPTA